MMRLVVTLVACKAMVKAAPESGAMIGCEECVHEMRKMGDIIRHHAPGIEVRFILLFKHEILLPIYSQERVRQNYCPSLGEELLQDCEEHLAHSYLGMLNMIVQVNITLILTTLLKTTNPSLSSISLWMELSTFARPGELVTPTRQFSPESKSAANIDIFTPSAALQVHLPRVCRGDGVCGGLHEGPPLGGRVHSLPRAELLCP